MNRRDFINASLAAAGSTMFQSLSGAPQKHPDEADRPNVIWIMADQLRAQALSCNGDPNVRTPTIDNLSNLGSNCTGAVSGFPLCCPFRG